MLQSLRSKLGSKEEGFTLIELMVVVLIIAILIAIAIPTFLGARQRAQDKAAQSNLRNALVTEDEYYVDNQAYSADNAAGGALDTLEPQLEWGTLAAAGGGVVASLDAANDQTVILRSQSASGTIFCIGKIATGAGVAGTYYTTGCAGGDATAVVAAWDKSADLGW